jgi:hypothetical protein
MLDIDKLKNRKTLIKLETYEGKNEYLISLKEELKKKGTITVSPTLAEYIENNFDRDPIEINKVIDITEYLGEQLKEKFDLNHIPQKVLVEWVLGDTEKSYHVKGKVFKNQKYSPLFYIPKTQVFENLMDISIDVDVNFDKYQGVDKRGWKAFPHQESGIKFLLSKKKCILADDMGLGKAASLDSNLLTPKGYIKMGDVKVGDFVIGSNGKKTKVTGIYPQGIKKMYNITFTDGTIVETCDEHLWAVQTTNHKKRGNKYVIKPLKELIDDLTYGKHNNLKWYIPIVEPVEFDSKENFIVDPYLMGVLLGDGSISQHTTNFSSEDTELINSVGELLPKNHIVKHRSNYDYGIISENGKNIITRELKKCDLLGTKSFNKFIPKNYLYSNIESRISLLQGLLDTDGYCSKKGTIQFYSVSKQLSDDVKFLVQSLGGVARQSSKIGSYRLKNGVLKECKESFILTINLPEKIQPFKLERKLKRLKTNKKYNPTRGIKEIEFSRYTEAQCISVKAEDRLYVMDECVVTHNTYQSIVAALETGAEKVLVICPANAKINWYREIANFVPEEDISILKTGHWNPKKFTIINYDILKNFHTLVDRRKTYQEWEINRNLVNEGYDLIIMDEAHMVKNPKADRTKIINQIAESISRRWLLTGTPIANRPMDYYNLLNLCESPVTASWKHYAFRYCDGKKFRKKTKTGKTQEIWVTDGASNLEELHEKTKSSILRRKKEDHLDLPPKIVAPYYIEIDDMKQYDNVFEEYLEWAKSEGKRLGSGRHMVELVVLRKYLAQEKVKHTIELAEQAIENGQKVIIFTNFTHSFNALMQHFGSLAVGHNGSMNGTQKQRSIDSFQENDKVKVFVGNLVSAGTAITLTAAQVVIMNDLDFVPANHAQAEDRAFRIGQSKTVNVYYPIAQDTIDEMMYEMLQKKKRIINTVVGDEQEDFDISESFFKQLMVRR